MKRPILALAALLFTAGLTLSGCGGNSEPSATQTSGKSTIVDKPSNATLATINPNSFDGVIAISAQPIGVEDYQYTAIAGGRDAHINGDGDFDAKGRFHIFTNEAKHLTCISDAVNRVSLRQDSSLENYWQGDFFTTEDCSGPYDVNNRLFGAENFANDYVVTLDPKADPKALPVLKALKTKLQNAA